MKVIIDDKIINKSVKFYGIKKQSVVCMEECAELIQSVSKLIRYQAHESLITHLTEEIADVMICIEMLKQMYGVDDANLTEWIKYKQHRIRDRVEEQEGYGSSDNL